MAEYLRLMAIMAMLGLAGCTEQTNPAADQATPTPAMVVAIPPPNPPPGDALTAPELATESSPPSVPAASAAPIDAAEIQARQAKAYLTEATQAADQRLVLAETRCNSATAGDRDDCISVATAAHESEMAATRLEFEARLQPQATPGY